MMALRERVAGTDLTCSLHTSRSVQQHGIATHPTLSGRRSLQNPLCSVPYGSNPSQTVISHLSKCATGRMLIHEVCKVACRACLACQRRADRATRETGGHARVPVHRRADLSHTHRIPFALSARMTSQFKITPARCDPPLAMPCSCVSIREMLPTARLEHPHD